MNVGRGLFRAWIVLSILWSIGAASAVYLNVAPNIVQGSYEPVGHLKAGIKPADLRPNEPLYEYARSPSAEKLSIKFLPVDWQQRMEWDKDTETKPIVVDMPDGSRVYISSAYNDADKKYIAGQFWDQRWGRYGDVAETVALWALAPCVVLFILGYALLWVGRGFSRA